MTRFSFHVFAGSFGSETAAMRYVEYDESRDEDDPESRFAERNLGGAWFDHDFVETVFGAGRHRYLESLLVQPEDLGAIRARELEGDDTFVLVMGFESNRELETFRDSEILRYCGEFDGRFE